MTQFSPISTAPHLFTFPTLTVSPNTMEDNSDENLIRSTVMKTWLDLLS